MVIGQRIPDIVAQRCLNLVHRGAECRLCTGACPVDAISFAAASPLFDADACVGCGSCVAACPTDVYDGKDTTERTLCRAVAAQSPDDLAAVCVRRDDPRLAPVGATAIVTHSRCLGSLDAGDLIDLSAGGKRPVVLDDSLCRDCPIGSVHAVISRTVDAANALLRNERAIQLASMAPGEPAAGAIIDGAHPFVTRRGLLRSLRRVAATEPSDDKVPRSRSRLLEQLNESGPIPAGRVPMAEVTIDPESCSACMACVQFCPTDALIADVDDEEFALSFQAATCLDCGICGIACPESAIQYGSTIVELNTRHTLFSGKLASCESCGAATLDSGLGATPGPGGQILCTWCRHGAGAVRPLHDEAGLFDDLNRHIDG